MQGYQDDLLRDISDRLDLVDIVSETVQLKRKGNRFWGLCPFHQEKTPSFSVTPGKNMFYCFGCHSGGDLFSFVMKRDGLEFREAVESLAARAGVTIRTLNPAVSDKRKQAVEMNQAAARYYHQMLMEGRAAAAMKYLQERGIESETLEKFQLGFAPDQWNALGDYLLQKGFSPQQLKQSGLIKRSESRDSFYDIFRKRIMFPIYHYNGDIIGFGGRIMDEGVPKYLNTPETEVFSKRNTLYGLYQGKEALRRLNRAYLVEGYMDCIKLHQAGIYNTVATLGTALTQDQARLIRRYCEEVVLLYDGDEAGQRESLRASEVLASEGTRVFVVTLPGEQDPDEFIQGIGKEEFERYIQNNKVSHIEFKINRYVDVEKGLELDDKVRILAQLKPDIQGLTSELERDYYIRILAQKLQTEESLVRREVRYGRPSGAQPNRNKSLISRDNIQYGNYSLEEKILASMLRDQPVFTRVKEAIGLRFWGQEPYRELVQIYDRLEGGSLERLQEMQQMLPGSELMAPFARITFAIEENAVLNDIELGAFIRRVQRLRMQARYQKIYKQLEQLQHEGDFNSLLKFILNLDSLLNQAREGGMI